MNKTLLDSLTDILLGMGLTEDDVMPLSDLAACLVELDLDLDGEPPTEARRAVPAEERS